MSLRALAILLALAACTLRPHDFGEGATDTTTSTTSTTSSSTTAASASEQTTGPASTTSTSTTGPDDGSSTHSFIQMPDGGTGCECDVWAQDCPEGQKCMPYSGDGDNAWDSLRCVDVVPDPAGVGEPCLVHGGLASGQDTCDKGAMCWDLDPDTQTGTCVAQCTGNPDTPVCPAPATTCHIANRGILILCLPMCHPVTQDCPDGDHCIPDPMDPGRFVCVLGPEEEAGAFDPCPFATDCAQGLTCAPPELALECDPMAPGCCLPFCDTSLPNTCPGQDQQCLPWYEQGQAPPGYDDVGVCGLPQP